jgi:osmotically-inducible protein OsmY
MNFIRFASLVLASWTWFSPVAMPQKSGSAPPKNGPTNSVAAKPVAVKPAPPKTVQRGIPDAELQRRIQWKFSKSKISRDNLQVRVENGVAIISGTTNVIQRKGTATRLAKRAGAKEVRNEVQISEAARQKAAANLQKAKLKRKKPVR